MKAKGVPVMYIKPMKDMYDGAKTWIRMVREDSKYFFVDQMGLYQGFVLIPFLFFFVMNKLT